jgi:hypothetical protein
MVIVQEGDMVAMTKSGPQSYDTWLLIPNYLMMTLPAKDDHSLCWAVVHFDHIHSSENPS